MKFIGLNKGNETCYIAVEKIIAIYDHEVYTDKWEFNVKETAEEILKKIKEVNKNGRL